MSNVPPTTLKRFSPGWVFFFKSFDVAALPQLQIVIKATSITCLMCPTQQISNSLQKSSVTAPWQMSSTWGTLSSYMCYRKNSRVAVWSLSSLEKNRWNRWQARNTIFPAPCCHLFLLWYMFLICRLPWVDCFRTYSICSIAPPGCVVWQTHTPPCRINQCVTWH